MQMLRLLFMSVKSADPTSFLNLKKTSLVQNIRIDCYSFNKMSVPLRSGELAVWQLNGSEPDLGNENRE
jgi:hypothetical protein